MPEPTFVAATHWAEESRQPLIGAQNVSGCVPARVERQRVLDARRALQRTEEPRARSQAGEVKKVELRSDLKQAVLVEVREAESVRACAHGAGADGKRRAGGEEELGEANAGDPTSLRVHTSLDLRRDLADEELGK